MKAVILTLLSLCFVLSDMPPYDASFFAFVTSKNITATPSQVHSSYPGPKQMLIQWVSASASDPSIVKYGLSSDNLMYTQNGTADSYSFEGYTSGGIHAVVLNGLNESTTYYYQVGGAGTIYNFRSAPKIGTEGLIFGAIGDVGADPNSEMTIKGLLDLKKSEGLDIVLHAGDLSYANNYNPGGPVWDHYGEILEPLAAYTTYNPSVGNHETIDKFTGFRIRYGTDILVKASGGGEFYWSFDYGNVHVVMISSESSYTTDSPQYSWLSKDLAKVDRTVTPWVIAVWHRPWYCSNTAHEKEGEAMRISFEPLFDKYKVDLGITGHVHAYERIAEINNFVMTKGKTAYVVVGNGGTPEGLAKKWETKPEWSQYRISEWGYSRLHVYNATHAHWTMRADSDENALDDYWFIKQYPR